MRITLTVMLAASVAGVALAGGGGERICEPCIDVDAEISDIDVNYRTVSGSTVGEPNNEYTYRICALPGGSYRFTFCEGGGYADYDTGLSIQGPSGCGTYVVCNDDYCSLQSQIDFNPTTGYDYVLVVDGFSSSAGNYTLAYRGSLCIFVGVEKKSWGSVKALYR